MHFSVKLWAGVLLTAAAVLPAQASLLGETLTFKRLFPNIVTDFGPPVEPQTVTVVAGPSDNAAWVNAGIVYVTIAPEATTITFDFPSASSYIGSAFFDGYGISGFSSTPLVSLASNNTGAAIDNLFVLDNTVYFDIQGAPLGQIVLQFDTPMVPEPASWWMLGAGLALLKLRRRT